MPMGNSVHLCLPILIICFLLLLSSDYGGTLRLVHGQAPGQGAWCVAKPSSSNQELTDNIKYVCENKKLPCDLIQPGGACFEPNNLMNHASIIMNLYYQINGRNYWNCNFTFGGNVAVTDPSYGE